MLAKKKKKSSCSTNAQKHKMDVFHDEWQPVERGGTIASSYNPYNLTKYLETQKTKTRLD